MLTRFPVLLCVVISAWFPAIAARAQSVPVATVDERQRATIHGQVLHANGRNIQLSDAYGNIVAHGQLDDVGRFRLKGWWGSIQGATLRIGSEETLLWLTPGDDLTLTLDARRFDETIHYTGRGARVNNFCAAQVLAGE